MCVSKHHREKCLLEVPINIDQDLTDRLTGIYSSVESQHPLYPQWFFLIDARIGQGKRIRHTGGGEQEAKPLYSPLTWLDD